MEVTVQNFRCLSSVQKRQRASPNSCTTAGSPVPRCCPVWCSCGTTPSPRTTPASDTVLASSSSSTPARAGLTFSHTNNHTAVWLIYCPSSISNPPSEHTARLDKVINDAIQTNMELGLLGVLGPTRRLWRRVSFPLYGL